MAVALMVGIAMAAPAGGLPVWVWVVLLAVTALAGGILLMLKKKDFRFILTLLLALTFVAIGALRCLPDATQHDPRHWTHLVGQPSFLTLRLTEAVARPTAPCASTCARTAPPPPYATATC